MDLHGELNRAQMEAVLHDRGPLLVLAGAGSGKTRVIAYRIAHLVRERGLRPENIIALTFTNKAAGEMRERVRSFLPSEEPIPWVGTFHSTCVRILRRWAPKIGYPSDFLIYDAGDQLALLKECASELNINENLYPVRVIAGGIGRLKNQLVEPPGSEDRSGFGLEDKIRRVYPLYQEMLRRSHAMDFDDLLSNAFRLLTENPDVADHYRSLWREILVDEYQDTNYAQYRLLQTLAEKHRNLFVVGDDDQSIYGWRGAEMGNILHFEEDFHDAKVIRLGENYRSTENIIASAGALISRNTSRKEKRLWTVRGPGEKIVYFRALDEGREAWFICSRIKELQSDGVSLGNVAVFYRINEQSRPLEEALRGERIPYRMVGALRFYERKEVKDMLSFLRVVLNPDDSLSLKRVLNVPSRGIGKTTIEKTAQRAERTDSTFYEAMRSLTEDPSISPAVRRKLGGFVEMLERLRAAAPSLNTRSLLQEILERTGYRASLEKDDTEEARSRLGNIHELIAAAEDYGRSEEGPTHGGFLDRCSLVTDQDDLDPSSGAVSLMTLHSSKGLEFGTVFIAGMENGLLPHSRSMEHLASLEEERRLCYVGMTRAKDRLFITNAVSRRLHGTVQYNLPSMFIGNIPSEEVILQVDHSDPPLYTHKVERYDDLGRSKISSSGDGPLFAEGTRVLHHEWGLGMVSKVEGSGKDLKLTVLFREHGKKKLMARYASLEII